MSAKRDSEIRQLVLAKSLYLHGCSHAARKDIVSRMVAIHNFDNVIEMVLKCVAGKRNIPPEGHKYFTFPKLLEKIGEVPLKRQVNRLHDVRNMVQHQGEIPSVESVVKYKGYTEDFLKEVCRREFRIVYEKLCLSELIENRRLRATLRKAERAFERRDFKRCIVLCGDSLITATFDEADLFYKAGRLITFWGAGEELRMLLQGDYLQKYEGKDYYDLAKELRGAILQWGQAATTMQFLGEYRVDFLKYVRLTETADKLTEEECKEGAEFCLSFASSLILKWQEEGVFTVERPRPS